ncbi:MAG: tRNA pseudouridine(55) synthase TruB [Negativicutes bacterium]|nr:tRNA pseudouridine(55) synthase TruB [Negativicutes bacterium]
MTTGIINVLKPPGMTSHDVVSFVRRTYGLKRVGHAGTLDPAAAGVLPVFLGPATRLIEYTTDSDKSYRVELTFGFSTNSGDDTGTVIDEAPDGAIPAAEKIGPALAAFTGSIEQIPPMHSAVKIDGVKLYQLARKGLEVDRPSRTVFISAINLIKTALPVILFDVTCSKGTYIRSLCMDIGDKLGCPAVMSFLVRTRVGNFTLSEAKTLEEIAAAPQSVLLPPDSAIGHLPAVALSDRDVKALTTGQAITCPSSPAGPLLRLYNQQGLFIGIGGAQAGTGRLLPLKILG